MREHQTLLSRRAFVGGGAAIFGTAILFSPAVAFATPSASDKKAEAEAAAAAAASKKAEAQDALVQLDALRDESDKAAADFVEAQMAQEAAQTISWKPKWPKRRPRPPWTIAPTALRRFPAK